MYIFERAASPECREIAFRLRYEVYCNEKKWLNGNCYSDGQEKDEDDERSVIFLAYDGETKQPIGTTRLIIHDAGEIPLPVAKHPSVQGNIATRKSVEISRMSILEHARAGNVFIGLIRMLFRHTLKYHPDFEYIFFSVEERFLAQVNRLGFEFIPFAPSALWYCDQLVPSRQIISVMDENMRNNNPEFHEWLWRDKSTMSKQETLMSFLRTSKVKREIRNRG
jgi:hypothetical protein